MTRATHQAAVFALVLVMIVIVTRTEGTRHEMQRPSAVAVIDLEKVFRSLHEKDRADTGLQRVAEQLEEEIEAQSTVIAELQEELEALQPGSDKHRMAMEAYELATLDYRARREFARQKIDLEKSKTLQRIYDSIKRSAEILSTEKGFDMVLVDDSVVPVPGGTEMEVQRQISARRMVFTSNAIDITEDLIHRMNQP
jgi:Skp family chaperone for outer membrane proteins